LLTQEKISVRESRIEEKKENVISLWALQNIAREILCKTTYDFSSEKAPSLFSCCRVPVSVPEQKNVQVHNNIDTRKNFYKNLVSCNSVWNCPLCACKISSDRSKQIKISLQNWYKKTVCHKTAFVTYTMPHNIGQSLADVRKIFMSARRKMSKQLSLSKTPSFIPYNEICENFGVVGTLTGIELTYGNNGWHLHSHEIFFLSWPITEEEIKKIQYLLMLAWKRALQKEGVSIDEKAFSLRSVVVELFDEEDQDQISKYITKFSGWSVADELVKSFVKKGHAGNYSIWDFLRIILEKAQGYKKYIFLFREYSQEMKGKRQVFFSKGMAELVKYRNIDIVLDPLISVLLGQLSDQDWFRIVQNKHRRKFLQMVTDEGFESAIIKIKNLKLINKKYKKYGEKNGKVRFRLQTDVC